MRERVLQTMVMLSGIVSYRRDLSRAQMYWTAPSPRATATVLAQVNGKAAVTQGMVRTCLELVETQREVQDLGELLGQSLLALQVLRGAVRHAGKGSQKAVQSRLCGGKGVGQVKHGPAVKG